MRICASCILLTALLAVAPLHGAELSEWQVPGRLTYGYGSDAGESMQGVVEAEPSIEITLSPKARLVLSGRVRLDTEEELEPGEPDRDTYSPMSRPLNVGSAGTAEVRDAYLEFELLNGVARFGKQQIVWGRLDGLKLLDTLNPQSFREFILDDFDRSRIGLWSAYIDQSFGSWRTEFAWIPDATGHEIPVDGAWFQLTAPRFRYGAANGQPTPTIATDRDAHPIADGAVAVRLSRPLGPIDVSAVAYSGLDFEPLGRLTVVDNQPALERFYERRNLYGLSAEMSIGSFAIRTEMAWQPNRAFNTRTPAGLDTVSRDQSSLAVAADVDGPYGIFVNLQYVLDRVSDAPVTLVRPNRDRIITAYLRRAFVYDTIEIEAHWYRSLENNDSLLSAAISYDVAENTRFRLAAETFGGDRRGLFGQFTDKDRLLISVEHTF